MKQENLKSGQHRLSLVLKQATTMGATILKTSELDKIYDYHSRTHMSAFCHTGGTDRGNTPYLITMDDDASIEEKISRIKGWIINERAYQKRRSL